MWGKQTIYENWSATCFNPQEEFLSASFFASTVPSWKAGYLLSSIDF